ncbi:hypothetical protein CDAR_401621 [Caerostris darwini]|uniref:Uncharacterized protein n=1 Tax=Caerostris darwini TaxID=1538125 RepID=A0AAV4RUV0_9ARAC|nr:hypothetical protein CDAR_401621 [Caerostris darwini]
MCFTVRHNVDYRGFTVRHNVDYRGFTVRHNVDYRDFTVRHNVDYRGFTVRHNADCSVPFQAEQLHSRECLKELKRNNLLLQALQIETPYSCLTALLIPYTIRPLLHTSLQHTEIRCKTSLLLRRVNRKVVIIPHNCSSPYNETGHLAVSLILLIATFP